MESRLVTGRLNDALFESDIAKPADRDPRRAGNRVGGAGELLPALRRRRLLCPFAADLAVPALLHAAQRRRVLPLQPDHHQMAVLLAARWTEYSTRGDSADACIGSAGLHLRRP